MPGASILRQAKHIGSILLKPAENRFILSKMGSVRAPGANKHPVIIVVEIREDFRVSQAYGVRIVRERQ